MANLGTGTSSTGGAYTLGPTMRDLDGISAVQPTPNPAPQGGLILLGPVGGARG